MYRVTAIAVVFLILVFGKILIKDDNPNLSRGMPPKPVAMVKPEVGECISMDRFMVEFPEATAEESYQMEQCNKERAARLGLDKRNTGF